MTTTDHTTDANKHQRCRGINYRICTALDMLKLHIVIDEMKTAGLSDQEAKSIERMASGLLAMIRTANHRIHGEDPVGPI